MPLDKNKILLTGATGLVGTGILKRLLDRFPRARIRASFHKHTKPFIRNKRIEYVYADLRYPKDCARAAAGCGAAIMAAAATLNSSTVRGWPWQAIRDNAVMNMNVLEALHRAGAERVVCVLSATMYQPHRGKISERKLDFNKAPGGAYYGIGWQNRFIEKMCGLWKEKTGGDMITVRAANVYGPYAKFDPANSNFIPAIIRKAVGRMDPFEVWGSPDAGRDVIYVDDFASAVTALFRKNRVKSGVFNVGSGRAARVGEVVGYALESAGHSPRRIKYVRGRAAFIDTRILDCSCVKKATRWAPRYSVKDGIKETTEWWLDNKGWWKR